MCCSFKARRAQLQGNLCAPPHMPKRWSEYRLWVLGAWVSALEGNLDRDDTSCTQRERGQRVYDMGNGNQARGQWREWGGPRETLYLANIFLLLGYWSSSKLLLVKVIMKGREILSYPHVPWILSYRILIRLNEAWWELDLRFTKKQNGSISCVVATFPTDPNPRAEFLLWVWAGRFS